MKKLVLAVTAAAVLFVGCGGKGGDRKPDADIRQKGLQQSAADVDAVPPAAVTAADSGGDSGAVWDPGIVWDTANNQNPDGIGIGYVTGIAWGGNKFVATTFTFYSHDEPDSTTGYILYSSDGVNWTKAENTTFGGVPSLISCVVWGGGKFVAGGYFGKMAYSSDGINWTAVENSAFDDNTIDEIVWGGNKFVAVGGSTVKWESGDRNVGRNASKMAYSSDGVNWTAVENSAFDTSYINDVAWGGGKFVACGRNGKMAYSTDGVNWTAVKNATFGNSSIINIVWGGGKFVAGSHIEKNGGGYGGMTYSSDGVTWAAMTNGPLSRDYSDDDQYVIDELAWGGGMFIAAGGDLDMTVMAYSPDGVNWTFEKNPPFAHDANTVTLAYINGKFAAGSSDGRIVFSK